MTSATGARWRFAARDRAWRQVLTRWADASPRWTGSSTVVKSATGESQDGKSYSVWRSSVPTDGAGEDALVAGPPTVGMDDASDSDPKASKSTKAPE